MVVLAALAACDRNLPLPTGGTTPPTTACQPQPIVPQRIERLTLLQETNVVRVLLSGDVADALVAELGLDDPGLEFFPPLESVREGDTIIPARLDSVDKIAATAGQYVFDHFADLTGCDADIDCARGFVTAFAERAYRRPLSGPELDSLGQELSDLAALGSNAQEVAQYGVYAVLMAPGFVYRTELGGGSLTAAAPPSDSVALTLYELASELSFMLTNGPPDAALLDAARTGALATDTGLTTEVDRLLATAGAKNTVREAVFADFGINLVENVVIDPLSVPGYSDALAEAMQTESRLFLDEVLWNGQIGDMLASTASFVNTDLATFYGVPAPPGATATAFVRVDLPADQRAGLLTRAGFITAHARTDIGDDFERGWVIATRVACDIVPSPPDSFAAEQGAVTATSAGWTQRAKAEQRLALPQCSGCHVRMDPYGLALEAYDAIGRWRTKDEVGQPVDTSATLPPAFDNQPIAGGADLSRTIAHSHTFTACLAQTVLHDGLPMISSLPALDSCVVNDITSRFAAAPEQTFAGLIREVARSAAMTRRLVAH